MIQCELFLGRKSDSGNVSRSRSYFALTLTPLERSGHSRPLEMESERRKSIWVLRVVYSLPPTLVCRQPAERVVCEELNTLLSVIMRFPF